MRISPSLAVLPTLLASLLACDSGTGPGDGGPAGTGPGEAGYAVTNCSTARGIAGAEIGTATWSAQAGPYCIDSTVTVTTRLTIEAGASVYAAAGATLQVAPGAALTAQGTAAAPVLLTARDTLAGWGGISAIYEDAVVGATDEGRPALTLTHVRLEHAGKKRI